MAAPRRSRLVLERPERTPDGGGGAAVAWVGIGHLWASIEPRSASETPLGDRPAARITHRIRVPREPGALRRPSPSQRLRLGERVFAIRGVAETPEGDALTLWVEEGPLS